MPLAHLKRPDKEDAAEQKEPVKVEAESHEPEGAKPDDEISDALGAELMDSIHSKDHKRLMGAVEATILHHLSKKED
jgi:hypothetical protein